MTLVLVAISYSIHVSHVLGYVSDGEILGSWFVRSLVIALHNFSHLDHLDEILTRVSILHGRENGQSARSV